MEVPVERPIVRVVRDSAREEAMVARRHAHIAQEEDTGLQEGYIVVALVGLLTAITT